MTQIDSDSQWRFTSGTDRKLDRSGNTTTTSAHFIKKKLSLNTCWSSVSIEASLPISSHKRERALFMKFLETASRGGRVSVILSEMKELYEETFEEHKEGFQNIQIEPPTFKYGQLAVVLPYFAAIWLKSMKYKSQKNKTNIIEQIKLQGSAVDISLGIMIYETMGAQILEPAQQWQLVEETCLNGWPFFATRISEIIASLSALQ